MPMRWHMEVGPQAILAAQPSWDSIVPSPTSPVHLPQLHLPFRILAPWSCILDTCQFHFFFNSIIKQLHVLCTHKVSNYC